MTVYLCNKEGVPTDPVTVKSKEGVIDLFKAVLDVAERRSDIHEFHCNLDSLSKKDDVACGVGSIRIVCRDCRDSYGPAEKEDYRKFCGNVERDRGKKKERKLYSVDDLDEFCEREFEV